MTYRGDRQGGVRAQRQVTRRHLSANWQMTPANKGTNLNSDPFANTEDSSIKQQLLEGRQREDIVVQALQECQAAMDAGESIDRVAILEKYPTIRDELSACLDGLELLPAVGKPDATIVSSKSQPPTGQSLSPSATLGDFRIEREIGRGGMGVVYAAEQLSVGRKVALKVLPYAAMLDKRQVARFQNEARAAATLEHPNIVPVYFVGNERGVYYYAMRLIEGKNLAEVLEELRADQPGGIPLSQISSQLLDGGTDKASADSGVVPDQAETVRERAGSPSTSLASKRTTQDRVYFESIARLAKQAAEALDFAHSSGIVHRDIKPANIMLDEVGDAWVTDFGLARIEADAGMTMTGDLVGTLRYMSPEQTLAKRVTVDHRSDVYSLGATMYELLTLQPLFDGENRATLLKQIAFEEPKPPLQLVRSLPKDLATIVLKSLEKDPEDRYATARELALDLERFLGDHPIVARPPRMEERVRKWVRRNSRIAAVLAICLMLIAMVASIAGLVSLEAYDRERQQKELALSAQTAADRARDDAKLALASEKDSKQEAVLSLERARQNLYRAHLREIKTAIDEGRTKRAESLLHQYIPAEGETDQRGWEWYHLLENLEGGSRLIARLVGPVGDARWSPDESKIMAIGSSGDAYIWDARTLKVLHKLHVPYGQFRGARFSPDGKTVAITSKDAVLRLWRFRRRPAPNV